MTATVSYYPQVSEWIYLGETAINMAQVASIEFGHGRPGDDACAIVRLSSYRAAEDVDGRGQTWFKVTRPELVQYLRRYVDRLCAPGLAPGERR